MFLVECGFQTDEAYARASRSGQMNVFIIMCCSSIVSHIEASTE